MIREKCRENVQKGLLLASLLFVVLIPGFSQDTLVSEEVTVLKNFNAQLSSTQRIRNYPHPLSTDSISKDQELDPRDISYTLPLSMYTLEMPELGPSQGNSIYSSFLSIGGGFPSRFRAEGSHSFHKEGVYEMLFKAGYDRAESRRVKFQGFRDLNINANGRYFINPEWDLSIGAGYERDIRFMYGNPFTDSLNTAAVRRGVSLYDLELRGSYLDDESDRKFDIGLDFSQLQDSYATSERRVILESEYVPLRSSSHQASFYFNADLTSLSDTLQRKLNNFLFRPSYSYLTDKLNLTAGLNIYNHRDEFQLYPVIEIKAAISGAQMVAVAGAKGSLHKSDFHSIYTFNNYIQPRLDSIANTRKIEYFIGIEGAISGLEYQVNAGYRSLRNFALFEYENNGENAGFFRVIFDNASMPYLESQISWTPVEEIKIDVDWNLYFISTKNQDKAWHRSGLQSAFRVEWRPTSLDWSILGQAWVEGNIPYRSDEGQVRYLSPIVDLMIEGRYYFSDTFDAYLQLRNLANQEWARWVNYPSFRANLLAGIRYRLKS